MATQDHDDATADTVAVTLLEPNANAHRRETIGNVTTADTAWGGKNPVTLTHPDGSTTTRTARGLSIESITPDAPDASDASDASDTDTDAGTDGDDA